MRELELLYIGATNGMEKKMIEAVEVPYRGIVCGKLRRYFSWQNLVDIFKIPVGVVQSFFIIAQFRPNVIFCKGGYVSFPVAVAGWILRVPVILHEADVIPGLANRLSARFAKAICVAFEESKKYFRHKKVVVTGNPVRTELQFASRKKGLKFLDFMPDKPIVLFMGGSLGAGFLNDLVWRNLDRLLPLYQVAHICGAGKTKTPEEFAAMLPDEHRDLIRNYRDFSFLDHELKDLYAAADVVVSRAGAMSLAELDFFHMPTILIPLSAKASRGDQIANAEAFAKDHQAVVMGEEAFNDDKFLEVLKNMVKSGKKDFPEYHESKSEKKWGAPLHKIIHLLESV